MLLPWKSTDWPIGHQCPKNCTWRGFREDIISLPLGDSWWFIIYSPLPEKELDRVPWLCEDSPLIALVVAIASHARRTIPEVKSLKQSLQHLKSPSNWTSSNHRIKMDQAVQKTCCKLTLGRVVSGISLRCDVHFIIAGGRTNSENCHTQLPPAPLCGSPAPMFLMSLVFLPWIFFRSSMLVVFCFPTKLGS